MAMKEKLAADAILEASEDIMCKYILNYRSFAMDTSGMASHDVTIACYKEWTGLSRQERRVEEEKALRHLASEKAASEESKSVDAKTDGNSLSVYPEEIDEGKGITMHEAKDDGNGKVVELEHVVGSKDGLG